ncbi:hypothetical protein CHS0354_036344 [Potamilus streckersoni]|uniref:Uncharacterized protein n=1 Tax=Potamilus streckersoni TaxID=2493646 RepID=A0AAE0VVA6_9BIVA|nr:hypothetical protein CHS0354_036344 [Potamilus streckersoni]
MADVKTLQREQENVPNPAHPSVMQEAYISALVLIAYFCRLLLKLPYIDCIIEKVANGSTLEKPIGYSLVADHFNSIQALD